MNEYIEANRAHWDEVAPLHAASDYYDVASFRAGKSPLHSIELDEVGDVSGKSLLHLQCHFGMDTLAWARLGATVTGVDFSGTAIKTARGLADDMGIAARFVEASIYDLPGVLSRSFDVVFASYGVLCWIPDFPAWARVAAGFVKPGGMFYLLDGHPLFGAMDDAPGAYLRLKYDYLASGRPQPYPPGDGSYAARDAKLQHNRTFEFTHDLGEVVTSLIEAGLQIDFLHEFPLSGWQALPEMQKADDGFYHLPPGAPQIPFLYSVRAHKSA